jgi:hypothetical protein
MFLYHGEYNRTAWYLAVRNGQIKLLKKLMEWAKQVLTQEEVKMYILSP